MTAEELHLARAQKWAALRPAEVSAASLRAWIGELGFVILPTLLEWSEAAPELLESELAAVHVVELALWPGIHRYAPVELLHYVYVSVGDRRPRQDYKQQAGEGKLSWLAAEVFETMLAAAAPLTSSQLRDRLGAERTSTLGVERALHELSLTLKVLRVGHSADGRNAWRPLVELLPDVPASTSSISLVQAAAALISHWLGVMICDTEEAIAEFFSPLFSRSRVHAALSGLEAGREVALDSLDGRHAYRLRS